MSLPSARNFAAITRSLRSALPKTALLRQRIAGLLRHHVSGVPLRPVGVALPDALLVLAVGCLGTAKCGCQIVCRCKGRRFRVDTAGKPRRNFLKQPAVAVRIAEGGERPLAAMFGIGTADPDSSKKVRFVRAGVHVARAVEHLADLHAVAQQASAGSLDVGDDQI
jgi:hypothetical protein